MRNSDAASKSGPDSYRDRLELDPETMERLGHRVVSHLVDHLTKLGERSTGRTAGSEELAFLREPMPETPMQADEVFQTLEESVFPNTLQSQHPRFFAWVPGPSNYLGVLADTLASGFNVFAGTWLEASAPAEIERVTVKWLCDMVGYGSRSGGLFVSGGSAANLSGIGLARQVHDVSSEEGVAYCSDQTHSSIARAFRFLNIRQVRILPSTDEGRITPASLASALATDVGKGLKPFLLVANLGTTNTGAVDDFSGLSEICRSHGLWLHVDAAYGGGALLCERAKRLAEGIELADSITLDPHKWMFQPYESGCLLVRDEERLKQCFYTQPEYLTDTAAEDDEINYGEYGLQLTRRFRALKLWLSLKVFGAAAFRRAVEHGFELAEFAEARILEEPRFELVSPARMGIVCFRFRDNDDAESDLDRINQRIAAASFEEGFAVVSSTIVDGIRVLRFCTINPRTTEDDILRTLALLKSAGMRITKT